MGACKSYKLDSGLKALPEWRINKHYQNHE